jgi:predicted metal-dependent HD superfamily phosphohydrolase
LSGNRPPVIVNIVEELYIEKLRIDWAALVQSYGVREPEAAAAFAKIASAYSGPGRFYHTLKHIWHVLETIRRLQSMAQDWPAVQFAAWFHDVIYDSQAKDNEEKSAEYAQIVLQKLNIPQEVVDTTTRLILCTKAHRAEPGDIDAQILLDADLAILGSPPESYQKYTQAIRLEYAWVSEPDYRAGRSAVLRNFLKRDRLYFTGQIFEALEKQARQNLEAEIKSLTI